MHAVVGEKTERPGKPPGNFGPTLVALRPGRGSGAGRLRIGPEQRPRDAAPPLLARGHRLAGAVAVQERIAARTLADVGQHQAVGVKAALQHRREVAHLVGIAEAAEVGDHVPGPDLVGRAHTDDRPARHAGGLERGEVGCDPVRRHLGKGAGFGHVDKEDAAAVPLVKRAGKLEGAAAHVGEALHPAGPEREDRLGRRLVDDRGLAHSSSPSSSSARCPRIGAAAGSIPCFLRSWPTRLFGRGTPPIFCMSRARILRP